MDMNSTFGCCFTLRYAMVSWCRRKHTFVSLSIEKVGYTAFSVAIHEAMLIHNILAYLFGNVLYSTIIHCHNQSCVKISENPVFHDKSKHIEIKYHYIRDMVQRKAVLVQYLPTDEQVVDVLTKPGQSSSTSMIDLAWQRMPPSLRGSVDICIFLRHSPNRTPL